MFKYKACVLGLLSFVSTTLASTNDELLSLIQVYRHGERAPFLFYPTDPYQDFNFWNTTPGDLTNTGKLQMFELGQYTRSRYQSFVPKYYSKEDFLVQASNSDRTFMSAAANVAGLYPPEDYQDWNQGFPWQPIPIFPAEAAVLSSYTTCIRFYVAVLEATTTIWNENQDLVDYISQNSGRNFSSILDIITFWDVLNIENLRNFTLPPWTESVFPEPLQNLTSYIYLGFSSTEELKILSTGPLFNQVIRHFEAIQANSSSVQKHLQFSGHDINLASILNSLGAFQPHTPGFGSSLFFELRRGNGQGYVNIYYSNLAGTEPVPITVAGCDFNCSLQDFTNILANITITPDEWYELCSI